MPEAGARDPVEWGLATRCRPGESASGDLAVVVPLAEGVLVAGIDGLGHGREAARAAGRAAAVLRESPTQDLVSLLERCHLTLQGTRGAAISLAFMSAVTDAVTWLGVGNVEGRLLSTDPSVMPPKESLGLEPGIAGHDLPAVRPVTHAVHAGDVLVLSTDGIRSTFADSLSVAGSAETISERILADHWAHQDDALVLVVRYLGARR